MTLSIGIDRLHSKIHLAATERNGSRPFTNTPTGYRFLLKWAREIAGSEPVEFLLTGKGRYASALVGWLSGQGQAVRWAAVRTSNC